MHYFPLVEADAMLDLLARDGWEVDEVDDVLAEVAERPACHGIDEPGVVALQHVRQIRVERLALAREDHPVADQRHPLGKPVTEPQRQRPRQDDRQPKEPVDRPVQQPRLIPL